MNSYFLIDIDPNLPGEHYYSLFLCLFQYFIPVGIMGYCYAMVASTMWKSRNTLSAHSSSRSTFNRPRPSQMDENSFNCKDSARTALMTRGGQRVKRL